MENYLHISFVLINVFQTGPWHYERECAVSYKLAPLSYINNTKSIDVSEANNLCLNGFSTVA